jgi:hypothetical protein
VKQTFPPPAKYIFRQLPSPAGRGANAGPRPTTKNRKKKIARQPLPAKMRARFRKIGKRQFFNNH